MGNASRIGVIGGGGWLGGAIVQSILDAELASPERLTLSFRHARPARFEGVHWTRDNQELADRSDVIVVSVRPADWPSLAVHAGGKLVLSVMAGVRLDRLSAQLGTERVVRALPNAAAEVGKSFTPWIASASVSEQDRAVVRSLLGACGSDAEVRDEAEIDYLTGLSGSGPAFPALLATAMMRDAVARGLDRDVARRAATAVLIGAGRLLERHDDCPAAMVDRFVGYRGTTAAAIGAMRAAGFETAVSEGLSAAFGKAASLGQNP
jgi:pyrroline-5-carboxylate reductase